MKEYIQVHPWKIIEEKFDSSLHPITESLMSIGNGRMGQRANYPEKYSGETLQGSYVAGIYYPDKTRVGWWKNGYPEYFAKVLNSVNWIGLRLYVNDNEIDLYHVTFTAYHRELDLRDGILRRSISFEAVPGMILQIDSERFYSIENQDIALQSYSIKVIEGSGTIRVEPYLDFNIRNLDSNYADDFWKDRKQGIEKVGYVEAVTKKTNFTVTCAMDCSVFYNDSEMPTTSDLREGIFSKSFEHRVSPGDQIKIEKFVSITSSFYYDKSDCLGNAVEATKTAKSLGYQKGRDLHALKWHNRWEQNDIIIKGDDKAQQAIRFNIFHLYQTYSGEDARLNIGPKGFTGEKYGGSTYWDTEAYCLPFYMCTASQEVARNLLIYRHNHLSKAKENAQLLGFNRGAALYPMVTMNGEECHNEWEITFEEIHRNGAIAYAIFDYIRYTGDDGYLKEYGLDVLIGISRFWTQRVNWSSSKKAYVMLGVTGPNEYENNVNNNWYTNYIARWCLNYTLESLEQIKGNDTVAYDSIWTSNQIDAEKDISQWQHIIEYLYLPEDKGMGIFLQQDGYLDKEDLQVCDLSGSDRPINQKWSWDRILRSPFIKQADVLQGLYFFEEQFDLETIRRNFEYYEPRTVHESSLSPCVHSILAARIGNKKKAYEMYLRTARLDLDDYNSDSEDGCHITSMAGTWMSIVEGFGGMRVSENHLKFAPFLPEQWETYSFRIDYRGSQLEVKVGDNECICKNNGSNSIPLQVFEQSFVLSASEQVSIPLEE